MLIKSKKYYLKTAQGVLDKKELLITNKIKELQKIGVQIDVF